MTYQAGKGGGWEQSKGLVKCPFLDNENGIWRLLNLMTSFMNDH